MGRRYTALLPSVARAVQFDAFEFTPADDKPVRLLGLFIGQTTELGDAAEEQLTLEILRGGSAMTSGSGGTGSVAAQTPIKIDPNDNAPGFTYDAGNETVATFTGGETVWREVFNVRTGYAQWFPPEVQIECTQSQGGFVVRLPAPSDSITWSGVAILEEE